VRRLPDRGLHGLRVPDNGARRPAAAGLHKRAPQDCLAVREGPLTLSQTRECGGLRRELGVYVVGAIAGAERRAIDDHLASCPDCRRELAELAGLPGLLARVPVIEAEGLVGPEGNGSADELRIDASLGSLLRRAADYRRHGRWPWLAAAAAAGLLAGAGAVAAGRAMMTAPAQHPAAIAQAVSTARGTNPQTKASAIVRYVAEPWGVELYIQVSGVPVGTKCTFQVDGTNGQASAAGSWVVVSGQENTWYSASSSVWASGIRGFAVTAGATTLVRVNIPEAPTITGDLR
jgi:Putative zinc-finger